MGPLRMMARSCRELAELLVYPLRKIDQPGSAAFDVAAIYDRATRTEAAKIGGVTLQIIRYWVMRCGPSFVFLARAFCLATVMRDEPPSFATNESEQR
jgi:hypothetical protein